MTRRLTEIGLACLALTMFGCGGQVDSFVNSVYVVITSSGQLNPSTQQMANGMRVVFVNNDSMAHTINWDSPLALSATAQPGKRAWFELPQAVTGTVLHYHLDANGPSGSVTVAFAPTR